MEKLIYSLMGADAEQLCQRLPVALQAAGAARIRVNCRDEAVDAGRSLIQQHTSELSDAIVQLWLPSANPSFRADIDALIGDSCERYDAWLVSESEIIANESHPPATGDRTYGFAQLAMLTLPKKLDWKSWRAIWRDGHTKVAIETQSNFEYVQNLVVEPLTAGAQPVIAIVEECFPPDAMTDPTVFFDASGDEDKFAQNLNRMMESCDRFIDVDSIDVFPTSQYNFA